MKKKLIKRGAHAATYLSVWWTLFSAFAVFDWRDAHRFIGGPDAFIPLTIWGIHSLLIGLAVYAWHKEKPSEVLWVGDDDEILDAKAEDIDLEQEKAILKSRIRSEINGTLWLIGFAVLSHLSGMTGNRSWLSGVVLLFGGVMILNIIGSFAKYFILQRKAKAAQK